MLDASGGEGTAMLEIDGYSDLVRVAAGGFAVVYRGRQDWFDREVAVKVLSADHLDERATRRFERECRAMGSLSWHPNVVAVLDSGIADGRPWIAMEYVEGGSLADRLAREGPLPWPDALRVGVHVAGALGAAHASGVLHRDLKPENLLIGPFGDTKLADFGIAAVEGVARTTAGHASFTVSHVAPEVLEGKPPDERSDLYGLASTLHTLIAGRAPFAAGDGDAVAAIIMRVLREPAPRLVGIPDPVADLIHSMLAKDPADRLGSAEDLGRALQAVQAATGQPPTELRLSRTGASVTVTAQDRGDLTVVDPSDAGVAAGAATRAAPEATGLRPPGPGSPPPGAPARGAEDGVGSGSRARWLVAAVAAVLLVVVGVGVASRRDGGEPATTTTPRGSAVVATVDIGDGPVGVAATATSVWVSNSADGTVSRIDPERDELVDTVEVGQNPGGVAVTADAVWVAVSDEDAVARIDPEEGEVVATVPVGTAPSSVAAGSNSVWVTNGEDATVSRLDPARNRVVATVPVGTGPVGVAVTESDVWVTSLDGTVSRIDPRRNVLVDTIRIGDLLRDVAASEDAVWITTLAGTVSRLDPATGQVDATVEVQGNDVYEVAMSEDAVWVTSFGAGTLTRIDPDAGEVAETLDAGTSPFGVAAVGDDVWVTNTYVDTVTRVQAGPLGR